MMMTLPMKLGWKKLVKIGGPLGRDRNRKYDWLMMFCSWLMMFDDIYVLSIDIFEIFCASICLHEV